MKQFFKVLSLLVVVMMICSLSWQNAEAQCKYQHDEKIVMGFSPRSAPKAPGVLANTDSIKAEAEKTGRML